MIFFEETYFFRAASPEPVILDCGSNIGMSVLYFKMLYPAARIIAPAAFAKLRDNVARNSLTGVTLHNCALSDEEGEPESYRDDERSLRMSLNRRRGAADRITVAAQRCPGS
jgi:FkbM family methyltransferase